MAITHSLPLNKWYTDTTSEWTLDYPPFFAYFEYALSQIAVLFDKEIVVVENLNYQSDRLLLFHRLSVIFADIVLYWGVSRYSKSYNVKFKVKLYIRCCKDWKERNKKITVSLFILFNAGLFIVDRM